VTNSTVDIRFRPLGRGAFVGGVLMTVAVHAGLAYLVYAAQVRKTAPAPVVRDVMVTRLVHIGKPREKFLLPRIVEPPPPKAPPPVIKVADDPNAAPTKKEPPRPRDPEPSKAANRALDRARALARNVVEEPPEGSLTGSDRGTSTSASEGDAYATMLSEAIKRNWTVPAGLTIGDVANLETEVKISVSPEGRIRDASMTRSSGNSLYDTSCLQAIEATRQVAPPPPAFRKGVVLLLGGKDLAQ
jgi:TonB family protein